MMAMHESTMARVIGDVMQERNRQDRKWGEQNHAAPVWMAIIGKDRCPELVCNLHKFNPDIDGFCAWAERRDDDTVG